MYATALFLFHRLLRIKIIYKYIHVTFCFVARLYFYVCRHKSFEETNLKIPYKCIYRCASATGPASAHCYHYIISTSSSPFSLFSPILFIFRVFDVDVLCVIFYIVGYYCFWVCVCVCVRCLFHSHNLFDYYTCALYLVFVGNNSPLPFSIGF